MTSRYFAHGLCRYLSHVWFECRRHLEQRLLFGKFIGIESRAQKSDDDELPLAFGHVAHDEVQVARGYVGAVLLLHHLEGFVARAVLLEVAEVGSLDFPVLDRLRVFLAAGRVAVEERELRRLQGA